jgi:mono/diheme cytochrome c family protein
MPWVKIKRILACAMLVWMAMANGPRARALAQGAPAAEDRRGLVLSFESLTPGAKREFPDSRTARLVALFVPEGEAPSAFTPAGPFRATFEGDLNVRLRTFVKFSAQGRGKLTLSVGGKPVLDASGDDLSKVTTNEVRLGKGKNHIVAVYESPRSGDANVRLYWLSKTWQPEPVPSSVFTHSVVDAGVAKSLQVRDGRELFAQFRCVKCHASAALTSPAKRAGMPELAIDAPALAAVGARFNRAWLAAWINDPHALRPNAHMPRLFKGGGVDSRASDIAAYLASLGKASGASAPPAKPVDGGRIFANLQCIACHTPPDARDDPARVPLAYVRAKFKPDALRQYLLNPQAHYTWNPMPNFHLSDPDAGSLAAYLLAGGKDLAGAPGGDPARGRQLVASVGCLNCHAIGEDKTTANFPALSTLSKDTLARGCLASDAAGRGNAPEFNLTDSQRAALVAFLKTDRVSLRSDCAPEFAERQIAELRCTGCHARDGSESLLAQSLDAESQALHARFPNAPASEHDLLAADQRPPMLTWAGEKLRPEWTARFIAGGISYKPRYYLRARMPSFPAPADLIAAGLAEEHGCAPSLPPEPEPDAKLAQIGRVLCGKAPNQGFSCVQCHAAAGLPPFAPFEAPSINLKYIAERLRHDYYARWMRDPQRIDPATKMPKFEDDEGKTGLTPFDHDGQQQFEAVWQYLLEGERLPPPQ